MADLGTVGTALAKSPPPPPPATTTPAADPAPDDSSKSPDVPGLRDVVNDNRAGTKALLGRLQDIDTRSDALRPPVMQQAPKPPEAQNTPIAERWGSVAMMLAGFGGLLTRQPLTASLNAMAAVNHAYNEGDAATAKSAFDTWKVENENAIKMNEFQVRAYDSAIKKYSSDRAGALGEIRANAAALKDDVVIQLLDSGQTDRALAVLGARSTATGQLSDRAEKLDNAHAAIRADIAANPNRDPREQAVRNLQYLAGKDPDEAKGGAAGAVDRDAITVANAEIAKQEAARGSPLTEAEKAQIRLDARNQNKQAGRAPTGTGAGLAEDKARAGAAFVEQMGHAYDAETASPEEKSAYLDMVDAAAKKRKDQSAATKAPSAAQSVRADVEVRAKARVAELRIQGQEVTPAQEAQIRADIAAEDSAKRSDLIAQAKARAAPKKVVLNTEAADMEAKQFLLTGNMPALGMGSDARVQILNRAAEIAAEQGHTIEDYLSGRATWKADTASLGQITKIADAVAGFEDTALKNMTVAEGLMSKGAGTKAGPVINRWLQAGKTATGDPDVAAFNIAMGTVASEYGKIISGGSASIAATPEGAREEAKQWLDKVQSPDAIKAQFEVARQDMTNRKKSLFDRREAIQGRISHPEVGVSAGNESLPAAAASQLQEGHETTFANGQTWALRNGKPERVTNAR